MSVKVADLILADAGAAPCDYTCQVFIFRVQSKQFAHEIDKFDFVMYNILEHLC